MKGRDFVTPDDVQELAVSVLAHRLMLTGEARFSGLTAESVVKEILKTVKGPPRREDLLR